MDYLRQPLVRTAAVLDAVASPHTVGVHGFRVAGYLLQKIGRERRFTKVPATTWRAVIDHVSNPQELVRAADTAMFLLLYECAEKLLRRALALDAHAADGRASEMLGELLVQQNRIKDLRALAEAGDLGAADRLVGLLVADGRADEAMAVCLRADSGQLSHPWLVADLLLEQGRVEDALSFWRSLHDNGDTTAADSLAALLADQGRLDDLRALADDGNDLAADRLIELLAGQGRTEALRALANEGFPHAADGLTDLLLQRGTPEEAIAALRAISPPGRHPIVATRLADLLLEKGQVDEAIAALRALAHTGVRSVIRRLLELLAERALLAELRALANDGSRVTTGELVTLLVQHGRLDDLRALAAEGHPYAAHQLAEALATQGREEEAIALLTPVATADRRETVSLLA
ncbi:tetratricopeptide repeat protein [Nonomuraea sp. NPDC023979]|uniref:tetratricopeptide repeat protein n=1 Tax=Nonomuraea sp. NPDC023979 TaxID=3154796 RepID=UPI0033D29959